MKRCLMTLLAAVFIFFPLLSVPSTAIELEDSTVADVEDSTIADVEAEVTHAESSEAAEAAPDILQNEQIPEEPPPIRVREYQLDDAVALPDSEPIVLDDFVIILLSTAIGAVFGMTFISKWQPGV